MLRARQVTFGEGRLAIEDVTAIAEREAVAVLSSTAGFARRIEASRELVERLLEDEGAIYGVNTGYGDSCEVAIPRELVAELPQRLFTYHAVGMGRAFDAAETRAILAARLASLSIGGSGVSMGLLEALAALLRYDVLPVIPAEGSVGASGDLTPLSYVAAVLCGEGEAWNGERPAPAAEALRAAGLAPIRLAPKEGLALMNGTAAMTGLACLAWRRAEHLCRLSARLTAGAVIALDGNRQHFDAALMEMKPHAGPRRVAAWIREDLGPPPPGTRDNGRLQDRYSIRCAPHVAGVLADGLEWMRTSIEDELNSVNDNPVVDVEGGRILHGGHFYGGHIAFAMDALKAAVASVADLMDRQLALLVDTRYSNGLPANLSGATGPRASVNHGLKALQIAASAWTAEALKLTMPAASFSRSTECHNQDKVSMGTIAARDALRVLELSEQVAAAMLIAVRQGVALRHGETGPWSGGFAQFHARLRAEVPFVGEDRRLDLDLRALVAGLRNREWA